MKRNLLKLFGWLLVGGTSLLFAQPVERGQVESFDAQPGDTLIVQNDYGRVRVSPWDQDRIEIGIRTFAGDRRRLDEVSVVAQKQGARIFLQSYFYEYQSESVYLDVQAPPYLNVVVWGANPAVELSGLTGYVRVNTLTGLITAENLSRSTSLTTESGNILYRSSIQPSGDIRLESIRGDIQCQVEEDLNLRGWLRAGRTLSWNREIEMSQGSLEKQVGIGGPLIYANSDQGNVSFLLESGLRAHSSIAHHVVRDEPSSAVGRSSSPDYTAPRGTDVPAQTRTRATPPQLDEQPASNGDYRSGGNSEMASGNGSSDSPVLTGGSAEEGTFSVSVNVDLIRLNASVRDRYTNRAVANLTKNDFVLYEDGVEQRITQFENQEAPFNLLLLLDVSGSTKHHLDDIKEASISFTRELKQNDRIAVATFNSRSRLVQDYTNDRRQVRNAIEGVRSGGGTAFYDALFRSVRTYSQDAEGRKAIVVFTDGVDNQLTGDSSNGSQTQYRDLLRLIEEEDILIYTIFFDTEQHFGNMSRRRSNVSDILVDIITGGRGGSGRYPGPNPGSGGDPAYQEARRQLREIADTTGGRNYEPRDIGDLTGVYSEIADDLRIQYTLGYHSTNPSLDGRWRTIDLEVRGRRDYVVRTRKGYYAGRN